MGEGGGFPPKAERERRAGDQLARGGLGRTEDHFGAARKCGGLPQDAKGTLRVMGSRSLRRESRVEGYTATTLVLLRQRQVPGALVYGTSA